MASSDVSAAGKKGGRGAAAAAAPAEAGLRSLWLGGGNLLSMLSVAIGAVSVLGYTFSIGYFSYVGPRMTGMFSLSDLLFMVVNSIGYYLILFLVVLGLIFSQRLQSELVAHERRADAQAKPIGFQGLFLFLLFLLPLLFGGYCYLLKGSVPDGAEPPFLARWGVWLMLPLMAPAAQFVRKWTDQPDLPIFTFSWMMCILANFIGITYGLGNLHAYWDSTEPPAWRGLPCVFLKGNPRCYDGLFIGSDTALIRVGPRIVAISRDDIRIVQSR